MKTSISYLAGGMLGDFIYSLSVINEKYLETGKKGILYISEKGDTFRFGLENTYNDTYNIIKSQEYIEDYLIYNHVNIDIDLTIWRENKEVNYKNWYIKFSETYQVSWGKHRWISVNGKSVNGKSVNGKSVNGKSVNGKSVNGKSVNGKSVNGKSVKEINLTNKVLINTTNYRWPCHLDFQKVFELYQNDLVFIGSDKNQFNIFKEKTGIHIEYYKPDNFYDLCIAINSCKLFIGSQSALLHIAFALHKQVIMCQCVEEFSLDHGHYLIQGLSNEFSNVGYNL